MARKYVLSAEAESDLTEIYEYIARDSLVHAGETLSRLQKGVRKVADHPEMGHFREELAPKPVRFWRVQAYLIIYRPDTKPIEIVRILNGFRDIPNLLPE